MSYVYDVNATCLRYVVPFKLEETFEEAVKKVESQKRTKKEKEYALWERRKTSLGGPESDLYSYIRNEFRFDNDNEALPEEKAGCEWLFWSSDEAESKNGQKVKELLYFPEGLKKKKGDQSEEWEIPKSWNITVTNLGLVLFRNGLGLVWYEIKLPQTGVDSNQLKAFQNEIRELNRGDASPVWQKLRTEPECGIVTSENNGYKTYISPFLFGSWVNEMVGFLELRYLAERKNTYASMQKRSMAVLTGLKNEVVGKDRKFEKGEANLPDKAILFSYVSLGKKEAGDTVEERNSLIYHIANGYKDSYHFSSDVAEEIKRPFDDAYWYATQEGTAFLAWPGSDNAEVFNSLIPSKVRTDYFSLFIKNLYQSFSLLIYAEKIQTEISSVRGRYLEEPLDKRITDLFGEINLFLTKSMATSVSHIHHQSEFYLYLKKQLRIHEDAESVTAGLNALDILQREQRQREEDRRVQEAWQEEQRRDREAQQERAVREERERKSDSKIQAIMGLFALLGISSALVDCFDFIQKFELEGDFSKLSGVTQGWTVFFMLIIGIISAIAVYFSIKAIIEAFRDRK